VSRNTRRFDSERDIPEDTGKVDMNSTDSDRAASHWKGEGSWKVGRGLFWLELPVVQRRLNTLVSGQAETDFVQYTLERFFPGQLPLGRCLSLACGEGGLERQLARLGVFEACDACDIAQGSIDRARELAEAAGYSHINYHVQDANKIELAPDRYDAVWAAGAVHHFERLEHVFAAVANALKPGGLFILHEYVGPTRFQFPPAQREAIQVCLDLLPPAYRRISSRVVQAKLSGGGQHVLPPNLAQRLLDKWRDGDLLASISRRLRLLRAARTGTTLEKTTANLPTARSVIAVDPSEAVRSADIVPILQQYFDIVEYKPLGGTILQFLLADIAANFEGDETGARLLEMLFVIEDALMEAGHLDSDFAYIVAAPKASAA
jgi:SAM-dependent methyltransferase